MPKGKPLSHKEKEKRKLDAFERELCRELRQKIEKLPNIRKKP